MASEDDVSGDGCKGDGKVDGREFAGFMLITYITGNISIRHIQ